MKVTYSPEWAKARDAAFDAGYQYTPTNFAPKGSMWHTAHGNNYPMRPPIVSRFER